MSNEHNEPAFPSERAFWSQGMTLRDYFAAKAMAAWIATIPAENLADLEEAGKATFMQHASSVADISFWYADAMLKARQQ